MKIEIFRLCTTLRVKTSLEIALSLTVFEIFILFHFPQKSMMAAFAFALPCGSKLRLKSLYLLQFLRYSYFFIFRKNPRWPPKVAKIEIFPLCTGHCCTILWVKYLLEITLSLMVFEIFTLFHFPQKSMMAAKN